MYYHLISKPTTLLSPQLAPSHCCGSLQQEAEREGLFSKAAGKGPRLAEGTREAALSISPLPPPSPPSGFQPGHWRLAVCAIESCCITTCAGLPRIRQRTGFESGNSFLGPQLHLHHRPPSIRVSGTATLVRCPAPWLARTEENSPVALCPALRVECSSASP